jgi:hypothetical protein
VCRRPSYALNTLYTEEFYHLGCNAFLLACSMLLSCLVYSSTMKMEAICYSEMTVIPQKTEIFATIAFRISYSTRKKNSIHLPACLSICLCIYLSMYLSVCLSMALQPFLDLGRFVSSLIYTQSVELLGQRISPSQGRYLHTEEHKYRINADKYPCLEWDSNPQHQSWRG